MKKYQLIANTIKERIIKRIYPQQSFLPKQEELEIEQIVWTNSGVNIEYSRSRNVYSNRSYIMVESSH